MVQKTIKILLISSQIILLLILLYVYSGLKESITIFNDMNSYYLKCSRESFFYASLIIFSFTNILSLVFIKIIKILEILKKKKKEKQKRYLIIFITVLNILYTVVIILIKSLNK